MPTTIAQTIQYLIKNVLIARKVILIFPLLITLFIGCNSFNKTQGKYIIQLPSGLKLKTKLAITIESQIQGLSGVRDHEFKGDQAILFLYKESGTRSFWMPDTYFNLNIIYLDKDLKVLEVLRNVPHHPGRREPPRIHRAPPIFSRHVLEIRSNSKAAKEIKTGMLLNWISSVKLSEII